MGAKINILMQNGRKLDMLSTQLREMQKRRSLLVLKTIKITFCVTKQMEAENQDVLGCREMYVRWGW